LVFHIEGRKHVLPLLPEERAGVRSRRRTTARSGFPCQFLPPTASFGKGSHPPHLTSPPEERDRRLVFHIEGRKHVLPLLPEERAGVRSRRRTTARSGFPGQFLHNNTSFGKGHHPPHLTSPPEERNRRLVFHIEEPKRVLPLLPEERAGVRSRHRTRVRSGFAGQFLPPNTSL